MNHRGPAPITALAVIAIWALAVLAALGFHSTATDRPAAAARHRALLIGLDGADWVMLDRWIAEGELPHLSRLARTGLRGDLRTLRPIISPLIWTSIATGQPPEIHGVTDFFAPRDRGAGLQPVSRLAVRTPPVWNRLSGLGIRVDLVAWWASWPADPAIDGRVVTDRVQFAFPGVDDAGTSPEPGLYHPAALAARLEPVRLSPNRLDHRTVEAFVPGGGDPPALLGRALAATTTYYRMTRALLADGRADLTAVYFLGTDTVAHLFASAGADDPRGGALLRYYRLVDTMVGDLCLVAGPDTLVTVVSDHGFYSGEDRPSTDPSDFHAHAAAWHRPLGMVLFNAPWVAPGRLADASVLDIAPTLLWQLAGERSTDLPGRVLLERRSPRAAEPAEPSPTERPGDPAGEPAGRPEAGSTERYIEQLRALGYLEEDATPAAGGDRPLIHLADYLQWAGRPDEALALLEEAPDPGPALRYRLAIQRSRAGQPGPAMEALESALGSGLAPMPHQLTAMAGLYCAAGRPDRAEALLASSGAEAHTARALLAEHRGRPKQAVEGYAAALRADPADRHAARSLCRLLPAIDPLLADLCARVSTAAAERTGDAGVQLNAGLLQLATGETDTAQDLLRRAVNLEPDLAEPRLLLGRALYAAGRPAEAYERLSRGLHWHPDHPGLLAAAGAAAVRAGYPDAGEALLERAAAAGPTDPHIAAALQQIRPPDTP